MASSTKLSSKRKLKDDLEIKPVLKKHKDDKEIKSDDDLETKPVLKKHKEEEDKETKSDEANSILLQETIEGVDETPDFVEDVPVRKKTLFAGHFPRFTRMSHIVDFFKEVGQVVRVRFLLCPKGFRLGYGFVEFASADEAEKALQKKNGEVMLYSKILLAKVFDETEDTAVPKKTLFVGHLFPQTEISDIINFFKDVGKVVNVRLIVDKKGNPVGCGFVEFASANEAMQALQKKNGEYLQNSKIFLVVANNRATNLPPKYCIDHKVWYKEDYLQPIEEDDSTLEFVEEVLLVANLSPQTTKMKQIIDFFKDIGEVVGVRLIVNHKCQHVGYGFVEFASAYDLRKALKEKNGEYLHDHRVLLMKRLHKIPDPVEVDAAREKTLFVGQLSPETEISDIINFFKDAGQVVHVRLIVGHGGKHLGHGYVEFASAKEAEKALEKKIYERLHDSRIVLGVSKQARNPRLPKLCIDHKVWYEDEAGVEGLNENLEEVDVIRKTIFFTKIRIEDIIKIFKNVVRVRVIVNHRGENVGGFLEFASAKEAEKALETTNRCRIHLNSAEIPRYPLRLKYNIAEKLC